MSIKLIYLRRIGLKIGDDLKTDLDEISLKANWHHMANRRDYKEDTQTVVRWLEGTYPDFFYVVELEDIEQFVGEYNAIENRQQYEEFVARYGLRRTNEDFWLHADWFNQQYAREQPSLSGIFDLNRYQNR